MRRPKIIVVGSLNMDIVLECDQIPDPGQTLMSKGTSYIPGGKGANQAVAAARAGGDVTMIGRVGDDAFGYQLTDNLKQYGIDTDNIQFSNQKSSGMAVVMVDTQGQNSIVVSPGANNQLQPTDIDLAQTLIQSADILLVQLEVPTQTVEYAIGMAKDHGVTVLLDPAPAMRNILEKNLLDVDYICPNQSEAELITGLPVKNHTDAMKAASQLIKLGAKTAIITMSSLGSVIHDGQQSSIIPAHPIEPIDSTAAGDAFAGAFAVHLIKCGCHVQATEFASAAGAISATRKGAQPSMPTCEEIYSLMSKTS